ncbi:MAG: ABC-three component system middle component 6 [Pseudomonadota bacterium]|nr:ABC-three component system middle component 6 [Pseudomonadota bacterium]
MLLFVARLWKTRKAIVMLLPDNIHPEYSIYYNGAVVLQILQGHEKIDLLELYDKVKKVRNMTFPIFVLCLDWLYLIDIAELKNNKVVLCS